jgi:hypothetical protein
MYYKRLLGRSLASLPGVEVFGAALEVPVFVCGYWPVSAILSAIEVWKSFVR